jgi:alpha-amylase/alpha-mannosidase (GH57 family)
MPAEPVTLVVHGHFYQPPRENPWTEEVAREVSAAPYHDWNERIAAECYRPNGYARVLDDRGLIVAICNNYEKLSFNMGPTLMSWLEAHDAETYRRIVAAGREGGAIAQAFSHLILPLASERDIRTQVRWGLADFQHRFGRRSQGMWLPEAAVNEAVLAILAEEGVGFTILAPGQAARIRPLTPPATISEAAARAWIDVTDGSIDTRRPYRWLHPDRSELGLDIVFYHGALSHMAAFELPGLSSQAMVDRVVDAAGSEGGLVLVATDGETFGHHQHWGDRLLAYALAVEAPRRDVEVSDVAGFLARSRPESQVEVRESSWSCSHGVGRWQRDCGCSTGGGPGWHQRWRAPLRAALDGLRDRGNEIFERRGKALFVEADPWAARDAYIGVVLGTDHVDGFAGRHLTAGTAQDRVDALTLLEAQRHAMAMYTSCGWFFNDLAGLETVQVLRYAAKVMDLLAGLGEDPGEETFMTGLAEAHSNLPDEGDGRRIWNTHVQPARVGSGRVVAHLALMALLDGGELPSRLAAHLVAPDDVRLSSRGAVALASGRVGLRHTRTGRGSTHVYGAVRLGSLEVIGAVRAADPDDPAAADVDLRRLREAFAGGASLTTLLRLVTDGFGPWEFGLADALPDVAERLVANAGAALAERFADACQRLFDDHRATLESLAALGEPLPPVLRQPAELALARRFEAEVAAQAGALDPAAYQGAIALIGQARAAGLRISTPSTLAAGERLLVEAVRRAVAADRAAASGGETHHRRASDGSGGDAGTGAGIDPRTAARARRAASAGRAASADGTSDAAGAVTLAIGLLEVAGALDLSPNIDRPQELVYAALLAGTNPELQPLGAALGLAVEGLGPSFA